MTSQGGTTPRTAAERQRLRRWRRSHGYTVLPIELRLHDVADALVEARWLEAWDADDPRAVADAIERLLAHVTRD